MSRTSLTLALTVVLAAACGLAAAEKKKERSVDPAAKHASEHEEKLDPNKVDLSKVDPEKVDWSKVNWKKKLTPEQYAVTRRAGTEPAFTGKYYDFFENGEYHCVNCGLPLFDSKAKFESGCGWPSFDRSVAKNAITEIVDKSHGMVRTEIRCRRCGAHLGHVFDDGPTETGLRYCLNSAAMDFVPEKDAVAKSTDAAPAKPADKTTENAGDKTAETR